jgi:hypothetical protein
VLDDEGKEYAELTPLGEVFISWHPSKEARKIISAVSEVCVEYKQMGYKLTSRQAYYQLVTRNIIPNEQAAYKSVTRYIDAAKKAGLLPWDMFEDRARTLEGYHGKPEHGPHQIDLLEVIETELRTCFYSDMWAGQPYHAEVFVEKAALVEIISRVADDTQVAYCACRGYSSGQLLKETADRFIEHERGGTKCVLLYVGDFDPSGVQMSEDMQRRLSLFGSSAKVRRLALNFDQVQKLSLPENPVKKTDTRSGAFMRKYGAGCWELDALEPATLEGIVRDGIIELFDGGIREKNLAEKRAYVTGKREEYAPVLRMIEGVIEQ